MFMVAAPNQGLLAPWKVRATEGVGGLPGTDWLFHLMPASRWVTFRLSPGFLVACASLPRAGAGVGNGSLLPIQALPDSWQGFSLFPRVSNGIATRMSIYSPISGQRVAEPHRGERLTVLCQRHRRTGSRPCLLWMRTVYALWNPHSGKWITL